MTDDKQQKLSRNRVAALEQDRAAGGAELRKMHTKSGEVVTVSLAVAASGETSRVILRFKWGGSTVQRLVGTMKVPSRFEALRLGWKMIREERVVEKEGWSWVAPSPIKGGKL